MSDGSSSRKRSEDTSCSESAEPPSVVLSQ